ncbi:MAG: protease B [Bacteroidia bacterium]|nr:protease B [Bacteroidia bacterium]
MKNTILLLFVFTLCSGAFFSCQDSDQTNASPVSDETMARLVGLGFDVKNFVPMKFDDGYLVEGDIFVTDADLAVMKPAGRVPDVEQYRTTNLVSASTVRTITMYAQQGTCNSCYSAGMIAGLDLAIARYNAENLNIRFQRLTTSVGANIVMTRLRKGEEAQGILGSAGFPTASGNPYNQIKMSGVLESKYGLSTAGIATIIAHEMGHCVGMRHTDYYNRAISCGGSISNEGDGGVGAILVPGTPSTATAAAKSWMLACTDGGDRPFNNDDKTALNYLY